MSQACTRRFGVFEVNLRAREVRKHGIRVKLRGQPFELLSLLLERPGEIISREEMRNCLWPGETYVDFEHSLNSAIKKLRAALGDSPENSRYIETVPRVGYRFIAPVKQVSATPSPLVDVSVVTDRSGIPATIADGAGRRGWQILLGISIALIATLGGYFAWSRFRSGPQLQSKIAG